MVDECPDALEPARGPLIGTRARATSPPRGRLGGTALHDLDFLLQHAQARDVFELCLAALWRYGIRSVGLDVGTACLPGFQQPLHRIETLARGELPAILIASRRSTSVSAKCDALPAGAAF